MRITQIDAHPIRALRVQKKHFPEATPGQLRKRETHNRYFHLRIQGPRAEKGRAGVSWARPGACRQTRARVPAASRRRCMRETGAAPPAALSPEPGPPKRGCAPTVPGPPRGLAGAGGRGDVTAEAKPPPAWCPRLGRVGLLPGPQRRAQRQTLADPPRLASGPSRPARLLPGVRAERPAGRRFLGEERAVQCRLGVPRPEQPARPARDPRHRAGAHPAGSFWTLRASKAWGRWGPPDGRSRPSAPVTAADAPRPNSYRRARGH